MRAGQVHQTIKDMTRQGNAMDRARPVGDAAFSFPSYVTTGTIHVLVDVPMLPGTPALVAFWKALGAVVEANAVVTLPKEIYLFGDPALGSQLFVRPCYPPLWKLCWKSIHDPLFPHLVILGNPGIGKTFFGFFILLQLARENKTVIYECGLSKSRYLFAGDTVVKGSQDDFVGILDLPTTYYIVDAVRPLKCPAMTILLTKPIHEVWFEFNEDKCDFRYMPVWAWDEISKCHTLLYSKLTLDVVTDRFRRWGGVPRYVLRYALVDTLQSLLERAIAVVNCDWVTDAIGKLDANMS
ncbi:hypothetical protein AaE_001650 [Aphanomyces astaci]|uniref:Crinkler (CRN) family protein n=1 Tax=Aphanomyces astaci TaxID=112090 RepID=A0A6A5AW01_APHAT|nr:hypothetical protein AaE_001650 [Aphanomyces astaci]